MNTGEMFDEIADKALKIESFWKDNGISSKAIGKEVEYHFFHNRNADFIAKFAYFYALEKRVKARYGSVWKILFRYFSWKRETGLLSSIKRFLKFPEYADAQSVVLQKSADFLNGEDCFGGNGSDKNALKPQKKTGDDSPAAEEKEAQTPKDPVKGIDAGALDKEKREEGEDLADLKEKSEGNEKALPSESRSDPKSASTDRENRAQSSDRRGSSFPGQAAAASPEQNAVLRERIEIPKEDLQNSTRSQCAKKQPAGGNALKAERKPLLSAAPFKSQNAAGAENDFIPEYLQGSRSVSSGVKSDSAIAVDINLEARQLSREKSQDRPNADSRSHPQEKAAERYPTYEQQKSEIAGEAISALSEEDMQAIKDVMQEELNRQMQIAEEKGEVYQMPVAIKEAIARPIPEKSEAQVVRHDPAGLNNQK